MKKKWIVSVLYAACLFTGALGSCTTTPAAETPEPEHVHAYAQTWSKDETGHWYAATCGHDQKLAFGNHAWGVPEVTKAATETE